MLLSFDWLDGATVSHTRVLIVDNVDIRASRITNQGVLTDVRVAGCSHVKSGGRGVG